MIIYVYTEGRDKNIYAEGHYNHRYATSECILFLLKIIDEHFHSTI